MLGVQIVDQDGWNTLIEEREKADIEIEMLFKNIVLPYLTEEEAFFLSQSVEGEWQGWLSVSGDYSVGILDTETSKEEILSSGDALQLIVYDEQVYDVKTIIVSGLPIVSLKTESQGETDWYGSITLIGANMLSQGDTMQGVTLPCHFGWRGVSAMYVEKKSYKVNLLDEKGEAYDCSFLGMYEDNDWILNPLYLDDSKIREKLAYDIWDQLSPSYHHHLEYVELILDGEYRGIYGLQESVEYATFDAKRNGNYLFSAKYRADEFTRYENYLYAGDAVGRLEANDYLIDEFQIEKYGTSPETAVEILRVLKAEVSGRDYESDLLIQYDRDNSINYTLLLNMTMAIDNTYKNQKFLVKEKDRNQYVVYKTPWDMDFTFQNENCAEYNFPMDAILEDFLYQGDGVESQYGDLVCSRYAQSREDFYNTEVLYEYIDQYASLLSETGAIARDREKWPAEAYDWSCGYLKDVIQERIDILDQYYGYSDGIQK